MSILNAYFFPDRDYHRLSETITPVNSFRVVLNQFFDAELEMLPEKNYYSTQHGPFNFIEVTERVQDHKPTAVAEKPPADSTVTPEPSESQPSSDSSSASCACTTAVRPRRAGWRRERDPFAVFRDTHFFPDAKPGLQLEDAPVGVPA